MKGMIGRNGINWPNMSMNEKEKIITAQLRLLTPNLSRDMIQDMELEGEVEESGKD